MIDSRATANPVGNATSLTGYRSGFETAYGYLLCVFTIAVLVQIYLAGAGSFGDHKKSHSGAFDPHEDLGHYLGIAAVVLFVLALVAHESRRTVVGALILALLTEVAQEGLAQGGRSDMWVGGLHAFNAALILGLSIWLLVSWHRRQTSH